MSEGGAPGLLAALRLPAFLPHVLTSLRTPSLSYRTVNLEDPALISSLFELFHGTADDESLPEDQRRAPAGPALRARLLALFSKSVAAANCFPHSLTVRGTGVGGGQTRAVVLGSSSRRRRASQAPSCAGLLDLHPPNTDGHRVPLR